MEKEKKIDGIRGEIIARRGDLVTLELIDRIDEEQAEKLKINGKYYAYLDIYDRRGISDEQRNYFWALMGDYESYTGYPARTSGDLFRIKFMEAEGLPEFPSIARGQMKMETARKLIQFILEYFIESGIPFHEQKFYLAEDDSKLYYALTMNRICWITGQKNAQLAHFEAVGMGRDRTKVDHSKHRFMMLSYPLHREQHDKGWTAFMEKYHLTPIKLKVEDLKKLRIKGAYLTEEQEEELRGVSKSKEEE